MSESILSQEEIDALLNQKEGVDSTIDDDLVQLYKPLGTEISGWMQGIVQQPVSIDGPYVETAQKDLSTLYHQALIVIPISVGSISLFSLITKDDGDQLAQAIGSSLENAVSLVVEEWVERLSRNLSDKHKKLLSYSLGEMRTLTPKQLKGMPLKEETFVVRLGMCWEDTGVEVSFMYFASQVEKQVKKQAENRSQTAAPRSSSKKPSRTSHARKGVVRKAFDVETVEFQSLQGDGSDQRKQKIDVIADVELPVVIELGSTRMTLAELMELKERSVIGLSKLAGEPSDIYINGKAIATGEIMVLDDNFGIRILEIVPPKDRLSTQ